jgi:hypothetical protein
MKFFTAKLFLPIALFLACAVSPNTWSAQLLVPMDHTQTDHLKAYGVAFLSVSQGIPLEWLLDYRGGSFLLEDDAALRKDAALKGVAFETLTAGDTDALLDRLKSEGLEPVRLEKAPRVAVYTPLTKQPWDDAVTLALTYAGIPFKKLYDREIIEGGLKEFDWLHLHHEDFTGQYSKFYSAFHNAPWYRQQVQTQESEAKALGFSGNTALKKAVALSIRDFVEKGGFLLAMCLASITLDMALAAARTDAAAPVYDGTPVSPNLEKEIDYSLALAFKDFSYDTDPTSPTLGNLDFNQVNAGSLRRRPANDFSLFHFSPAQDPIPSMLVQNHVDRVPGFFGLATSFPKRMLKTEITVLAEVEGQDALRYVHGNLGQGQFTLYGGHDPEDYSHAVGDKPTDLSAHKNSPGYRLILNNLLYPAARKKKRKT